MEEKSNEKQEKKLEKKSGAKKKRIIIVTAIIIFICLFFSVIFSIILMCSNKVSKGIYIENIEVSNYEKEEIIDKFSKLVEENRSKEIILTYGEIEVKITPEELETKYNIDQVSNSAYLTGRNKNIFINNFEIVQALLFKKNIDIEETINEEKLQTIVNSLSETLPGIVEEYSYCIEDDELIITKGKAGIKVKKEELIDSIKKAIGEYNKNQIIIEVPVEQVDPEKINIEKIYKEIYREAQNAYITQDPLVVHPNVNGMDFAISMDEVKKILEEDKEEYVIPLNITVANITLRDLGEEAFPNNLGTYSTKFNVSATNRTTNIKLATNKINGTVILPGETFSYNKTVGKRTIQAGFKEAGAYANGQVVQEVGGGICQVSSTLYNAVLYANLEIVERYNHHFETSYVSASRDATVSWGTVDFKFKNNRSYPIKIVATCKNGVETVSIYGIEEETEYEVIIQSKRISTIERTTKYEDDNTLNTGEEIVTQTGHDGCVSEAYKIVRLNGETISSTLLSRDTYHALDRIIKRGMKVVQEDNSEENMNNNEETTENRENSEIENSEIEDTEDTEQKGNSEITDGIEQ